MSFAEQNKDFILKEYDKGKSTYEIAELLNTYPVKIGRVLKKYGRSARSPSEAQRRALKSGRAQHPTEGKHLSDEHRERISDGKMSHWENLSEDEKAKICQKNKESWDKKSKKEKEKFIKMGNEALQKTSREGSQLERYLYERLLEEGYYPEYHVTTMLANDSLEVDIMLHAQQIAIEVDGISHYEPIWGEDKFQKQQKNDREKEGLLLKNGYCLIRVACLWNNISEGRKRKTFELVISKIREIEAKFPSKRKRIIHV